ncbi:nucleotide exchange factor GrpE [Clostridium sp.]|uniref:nucleotide exchange factor GrpE n=1 Tax=Clostridium sp. TaxID=1506 RepID=UPI0026255A06|nr:nucleotide exchange factor GrpE [Clostridium sp.]
MEENKKPLEDLEEVIEDNVETEEIIENLEEKLEENKETEVSEENKDKENELDIMRKLKDENKRLNNELETLKDRLLRVSAEYENHRKRTIKEKEGIYTDACNDVLKEMVPVLDTLERAITLDGNLEDFKKGIDMTIKGFKDSFEKLGVEEIDATGEFDPNLHQAVMHIEDEELPKNSVQEVFQKGYKRGEKVIRYTMVKVAN